MPLSAVSQATVVVVSAGSMGLGAYVWKMGPTLTPAMATALTATAVALAVLAILVLVLSQLSRSQSSIRPPQQEPNGRGQSLPVATGADGKQNDEGEPTLATAVAPSGSPRRPSSVKMPEERRPKAPDLSPIPEVSESSSAASSTVSSTQPSPVDDSVAAVPAEGAPGAPPVAGDAAAAASPEGEPEVPPAPVAEFNPSEKPDYLKTNEELLAESQAKREAAERRKEAAEAAAAGSKQKLQAAKSAQQSNDELRARLAGIRSANDTLSDNQQTMNLKRVPDPKAPRQKNKSNKHAAAPASVPPPAAPAAAAPGPLALPKVHLPDHLLNKDDTPSVTATWRD